MGKKESWKPSRRGYSHKAREEDMELGRRIIAERRERELKQSQCSESSSSWEDASSSEAASNPPGNDISGTTQLSGWKKVCFPNSNLVDAEVETSCSASSEQSEDECDELKSVSGNASPSNGSVESRKSSADQVFDVLPQQSPVSSSPHSVSVILGEEDSVSPGAPKMTEFEANKTSVSEKMAAKEETWVNCSPSMGLKLEFHTGSTNGCKLKAEDIASVSDVWGNSLIGYVAGRFPERQAIWDCCQKWNAPCQFFIHESGWLVFKFKDENDLNDVLEGGPYFILQRPLLLKLMPPLFRFDIEEMRNLPVWVILRNLPLELWNAGAIGKILSSVGKPIRTDNLTASRERLSYARALVEINVAKDLVYEVPVELPNGDCFLQEVVYEYIPSFCSGCEAVGHDLRNCKNGYGTVEPTQKHERTVPNAEGRTLASNKSRGKQVVISTQQKKSNEIISNNVVEGGQIVDANDPKNKLLDKGKTVGTGVHQDKETALISKGKLQDKIKTVNDCREEPTTGLVNHPIAASTSAATKKKKKYTLKNSN